MAPRHRTPAERKMSLAQRLDAYSAPEPMSGCFLWTGYCNPAGYGTITSSEYGVPHTRLAHRVAWIGKHGSIPDGVCVLHRCDTPSCVNPAHLFLGTQADNVTDCVTKGRNVSPPHRSGERNPNAKLTYADTNNIRQMLSSKAHTQREIRNRFGVSRSTIDRIVAGKTWRCNA